MSSVELSSFCSYHARRDLGLGLIGCRPHFCIRHFYISQIHLGCTPSQCISIVFNFSWDDCNTQEKWRTKVMQNLGEGGGGRGQARCIMGDVQMANLGYTMDVIFHIIFHISQTSSKFGDANGLWRIKICKLNKIVNYFFTHEALRSSYELV